MLGGARWAAKFASAHALPLTLLHVIPRMDWHFTDAHPPTTLDRSAEGDAAPAAVETAVRSEYPDLELRAEPVKGSVISVLKEASARPGFSWWVAAPATIACCGHAVRIAHRAVCPVVIWRQPLAKRTGKPLPVIVGVDESDGSTRRWQKPSTSPAGCVPR